MLLLLLLLLLLVVLMLPASWPPHLRAGKGEMFKKGEVKTVRMRARMAAGREGGAAHEAARSPRVKHTVRAPISLVPFPKLNSLVPFP